MAKYCRYCGSKLNEAAAFCESCGKPVQKKQQSICPNCGGVLSDNARFCKNCGSPSMVQQQTYQHPQKIKFQTNPTMQNSYINQPKKSKRGLTAMIIAGVVILVLVISSLITLLVCDFKWKKKNTEEQPSSNIEAMLEYAEQLKENGNPEAAEAVNQLLKQGGQADLKEASNQHRDDPERLMLDALSGEDLHRILSGK